MGGKFGEVSNPGDGSLDANANNQGWADAVVETQDRTSVTRPGDVGAGKFVVAELGPDLGQSHKTRFQGLPSDFQQAHLDWVAWHASKSPGTSSQLDVYKKTITA
jgi:hypothetical protein